MILYVVQPGDTLAGIAKKYNVDLIRLLRDNGLNEYSGLAVGECIVIQFPKNVHIVSENESLFNIATNYNTTVNNLLRNNYYLQGITSVYPGQEIVIDYYDIPIGNIDVNAYAYTNISYDLLKSTLPYLTFLSPFTYGIDNNGGLIYINDNWMINLSDDYSVQPLMHLSTLNEQGVFSNETASIVFNNENVKNNLINNTLNNIINKKYYGLDIDFEFINPDESKDYAELISDFKTVLSEFDYPVFAALAPKTSDEQKGTLYEGHNYGLIGNAADYVLLMTYEWGYTYGPPLAVAPINKVREVLDYAVTKIPAEKIYLGVPTYGYNWTLPYIKGVSRAPSISNTEAVNLAIKYNAVINYDDIAQSPWFNYTDEDGRIHEVWFEDGRSIMAKLKLVNEYGFKGVGYWDLMRPFPQNWLVLNSLYRINNY